MTTLLCIDICDFGAVGDGETKNTDAIQSAVNQCHANGGGRVIVPPGIFLTGTVFLKSNVELYLCHASVLKASPDLADYNQTDCFAQNNILSTDNVTGAHLIIAHEVVNVAITGSGMIDGNSPAFFDSQEDDCGCYVIKDQRPGQMLFFCESETIRLADITLKNAPYWACFLHGCENVFVRGMKINSLRKTKNGDGIDIDCCRNVTVSDCIISCGDDCITLRGANRHLKNKSRHCENVTVTNCVLNSPCNALRIGVGEGTIRNCIFSNIVIENGRTGVNIVSKYSRQDERSGVTISNIKFMNFIMDTIQPFYIVSGWDATVTIENIYFSGITATASKTSCIHGNTNVSLKNLHFENVDIEVRGGKDFMTAEETAVDTYKYTETGAPLRWGLDTVFLVGKADHVEFKDVKFNWENSEAPWQHCFKTVDCENFAVTAKHLSSPPATMSLEK